MTWEFPVAMAAIPLFLGAVCWLFRARGERAAALAQIRRLWADAEGLHDAPRRQRRRGRGLLLAAGTALAVLALARPQWGTVEETSYEQSREVLIALDLSRSMLADDVSPTRLERAKLLVDALLDQLRGERVGLAVFAGTSFLQSPLSAEYDVLRDFLRDLDPSYLPQGGTDYAAMLQTASRAFREDVPADRFLVVLSDGEAHDADWQALLPSLKQKGIRVIGLGVGTESGALVPDGDGGVEKDEQGAAVLSRLEPRTLQELATQTGGTYRDAATWVDVAELVDATVDQGAAGQFVERKEARLRDRYQWLLAPALLLLLFATWLEFPILPVPRTLERRQARFAPLRNVAAAALLLALAAGRAPAATTAPEPSALERTVAALADKPSLAPLDYAALAQATIAHAAQPETTAGDTRLAVIDDALGAVDAGERGDRTAADWPELRRQLQALRQVEEQKQNPEDNQQNADNQEQEPQNGSGGDAGEDGQASQDGGAREQASPAANENGATGEGTEHEAKADATADSTATPSDGASPTEAEANAGADAQRRESESTEHGAEREPHAGALAGAADERDRKDEVGEPRPLDDASARIGDLQAEEAGESAESAPPPPAEPSRMIGGGNVASPGAVAKGGALADALARMEQVQQGDSPATLFARMNRAEGAPPPSKSNKNW